MERFTDIIGRWETIVDFAADIEVGYVTAHSMKLRDSVDAKYWKKLLEGARRRGFFDITPQLLIDVAYATERRRTRARIAELRRKMREAA